MSEDIINGECCDLCGCYFKERFKEQTFTHGHPATCTDCWDDLTKEERKHHTKCDGGIVTI